MSSYHQINFRSNPIHSRGSPPACAAAIAHRNHYFNRHSSTRTDESHRLFKPARNCCKRVLDQAKLEYAECHTMSLCFSKWTTVKRNERNS